MRGPSRGGDLRRVGRPTPKEFVRRFRETKKRNTASWKHTWLMEVSTTYHGSSPAESLASTSGSCTRNDFSFPSLMASSCHDFATAPTRLGTLLKVTNPCCSFL